MISETELKYLLALQRTPNLGDISIKKILSRVGSAKAIYLEKKSTLAKIEGIGTFRLEQLNWRDQLLEAEKELNFIQKNNINCLYFQDVHYPDKLKHCIDGPVLLFSKGNIDLKGKKIISVVGTRQATVYGKVFCETLIDELAPLNPVIVSGLAYGIDIYAHKAALKNNLQTVACLAHSFTQIYPKEHKKYAKSIEANGGFFTESWSADAIERNNFLKRNRIIAGLSEATVVIESGARGGSLNTAEIALSYNREVFAVPGRVTDSQSRGCINLIKNHKAHTLTEAVDIIYELNWKLETEKKPVQTQLFVDLDDDEKKIYDFLKDREKELLDIIAIECGFPVFRVATLLVTMELKGVVRPLPGKQFQLA